MECRESNFAMTLREEAKFESVKRRPVGCSDGAETLHVQQQSKQIYPEMMRTPPSSRTPKSFSRSHRSDGQPTNMRLTDSWRCMARAWM